MSTVSLQMIVKDEVDDVVTMVTYARHYFDDIYLTVSDKTAKNKIAKRTATYENVHVNYREWSNDFADARNANWALGANHDYSFWVDADDYFDFTRIPELVSVAEGRNLGAIYLPYNYAQDDAGRCIARHWRERLVARRVPFQWRGRVHESLVADTTFTSAKINQEVKHLSNHIEASSERNHKILVQAAQEDPDPRYLHYLGLSYYGRKEYQEAIDIFEKYIQVSGWDEEIYRSYLNMSESSYQLEKVPQALDYALKAIGLFPHYPQAYWLMAQYENDQDNYKEALEWVRVAETKQLPDTMSIVDPTCAGRNRLVGAQACFMLGNYNDALAWLKKSGDPLADDLMAEFTDMADTETFLTLLPRFRKYFQSDSALWKSLSRDLQYDNRVRGLRDAANPPQVWADKTITILCGQGYEEWGPHTLDKGMGGSEEAIVYLTRELAKQGWDVTVYGEVSEEKHYDYLGPVTDGMRYRRVTWLPWREFDRRDEFNVLVVWRSPISAEHCTAKVKIADIHDIIPEDAVKDYSDVTYFVKSQFHRNLYPKLPDAKFHIIGNGIKKDQF